MIKITFTIEDTENPDALINGTTEESFHDLDELSYWLENYSADVYHAQHMERKIKEES